MDYDDTLLPTTFLDPADELEMEDIVKIHKTKLENVQNQVMTLFESFLRVSKVLIITNAKPGWVEYSSSILMPEVYKMIIKYIPVISARGEFEHKFPGNIQEWKKAAFLSLWDIEGLIDKAAITNLVVIGDAQYEMDAGKNLCKTMDKCLAK